ncbi:hypothetical protein C806_04560 [Lachnospiraceae bacterium 3-1]|nr:hypothetical protein C806_04560 [Lachnospiraceae bacterium 3-1]
MKSLNKGKEELKRFRQQVMERTKEERLVIRRKARQSAKKWNRLIGMQHMFIGALVFGLITGVLSYSGVLEEADHWVSDGIYHMIARKQSNSYIRIISIDEKTVKKYGEYEEWSREKTAKLIRQLNQWEDNTPSVIGLDLDYSEEKDPKGDQALVEACSDYKNICFSAHAVLDENTKDGRQPQTAGQSAIGKPLETGVMGERRIEEIRKPFDQLFAQVTVGIANSTKDSEDGFVRGAFFSVQMGGAKIDSFATAIYKMHRDNRGKEYTIPKLEEDQSFQFTFSKRSQEYTTYSFVDVLEGRIDPTAFGDCIVLVGEFTEDMTFRVPNQRNTQMYELEMQANILEALLEQRTGQEASKGFMAVFFAFFMAMFFIATSYSSDKLTIVIALLMSVIQLFACWIVNLCGYYVNILVAIIMFTVITIYSMVVRYFAAIQNQYAMEGVFKKYVDENIITALGKDGRIEAHIGVVSKDIAVLFVDIRGFTSLSESLPPEQIVEILNAYLELVAQVIAKYQGTLDKFIGDAAMAVFNSPIDLEDYEFRAVCAALELCGKASNLNEMCKKEYGKQVTFGIGIQCGEAVIGNIGCEMRMDYTAIGDTVNTAARLEGAASSGQILISREMMQRLRGRIKTRFAGEYTLKGKRHAVPTYAVEGIIHAE